MNRDFSESSKQKLIELVEQVENEKWCDFTDWIGDRWYDFMSLVGELNIKNYIDNVNGYHKKVIDKNNVSIEQINRIFDDVKNVDLSYTTRLAAIDTQLTEAKRLIDILSSVIDPSHGLFEGSYNSDDLEGFFNDYYSKKVILDKLGDTGISADEADQMGEENLQSIMGVVGEKVVKNFLPNMKLGSTFELPIGPDLVFYCSVSGKWDPDSPISIDAKIDEQKELLLTKGIIGKYNNKIKIGAHVNEDDVVSVDIGSDNASVTFNSDGKLESSYSIKVSDNTYKYKCEIGLEEMKMEESVTFAQGQSSVTTAIGIKKTNTSKWVPIPIPVEEPVPVTIPQLEVNWEIVAGVACMAVIVAGLAVLTVVTDGAAPAFLLLAA